MTIDRKWMKRNLGFDPYITTPPASAFANPAAAKASATPEDFQREIIDFDSQSTQGKGFLMSSAATGLSLFQDIPWPRDMAPKTAASPGKGPGGALPEADVLVVVWTVDEGHATSRVLTPGKDSKTDYLSYTHNFSKLKPLFRIGCPARNAGKLGTYWKTTIAGRSVVVFKSESHLSQDGPKAPNIKVWQQLIDEVKPKLVLTTGTGGGIGRDAMVGDVVVSQWCTLMQSGSSRNCSAASPHTQAWRRTRRTLLRQSGCSRRTHTACRGITSGCRRFSPRPRGESRNQW